MTPGYLLSIALALSLALSSATTRSLAQANAVFTAQRITFTNPGDLTQSDLEAAAGLHPGDKFKSDDLTAAAQRLSDTGFFDTVGAGVDGNGSNVPVTFMLKPLDRSQLLHAGFENFVWLSPDEITTVVHTAVPLFHGYLPELDAQAALIDQALIQALATKGVTAAVTHVTVEPTLEHPERVIEFRVRKPGVIVGNIKLSGISPELIPLLQKSVNATAHKSYNAGLAGDLTATRILAPLLDAGYVQAALSDLSLAPTVGPDGTVSVVVSARLSAGDIYHVGKIVFAGATLMPPPAFAATQKLHEGDIAAHKALLETLAPLDAAYRSKGYMDVIVSATPTLDAAAHTVDYAVDVQPGEPYRIREINAVGLAADARSEFDRGFLLKPGDIYNPDYINNFFKNNTALTKLNGYSASYKAVADPTAHTVDVLLTFFRAAQ